MAHTIYRNNARTTVNAALTTTATSITVVDATLLAQPGANQVAYATLRRALTGEREVITYTSATGTTVSGVTRDVEVTPDSDGDGTGLTFVAGDFIENRIPKGLLDEFVQRQGTNAGGDNKFTGSIKWSNAAGPEIMDEAATATNPTLVPNQAEEDTGWGWASDVLVAVLAGVEQWRFSGTQVLASNAAGPSLQNEAASATNPTLIPNQAEVDTGWGWVTDVLVAVLGGAEKWRLSGTQVLASDAAGPALQNEAATATNPTLIPNQAEVDTGWGWASDVLVAVLGGAEAARISATQFLTSNAAGPSLQNEAATTTNPTLVTNQAEVDTGWGWSSDALEAVGGGVNLGKWSATGIEVNNATGGAVLNEAASGTNPTLAPSKADLDTGVGTASADVLDLVSGGVNAVKYTENVGVIVDNQITAGITASTTQTQGNGALTSSYNEVSVVANANDTVTLPTAVAGRKCVVINNGASTLQVFPASGDNLGAGLNTSETIATASSKEYVAYDETNWDRPDTVGGTPPNDSVDKAQLVAEYANGWVFIEKQTLTSGTVADFAFPSGYDAFKFIFNGIRAGTDDQALHLLLSDDAGVSFEEDAADYGWLVIWNHGIGGTPTVQAEGDVSDSHIPVFGDATLFGITNNPGNAADETCEGELTIYHPLSSSKTKIIADVSYITADGEISGLNIRAWALVAAIYNAARFDWEGATEFAAGTITMFGLRTDQT